MKAKKPPPQARSQRAVREGRFNETLDRMNKDMGQKVARTVYTFYENSVRPLEQSVATLAECRLNDRAWVDTLEARILQLETPWYQKLWVRISSMWSGSRMLSTTVDAEEPNAQSAT